MSIQKLQNHVIVRNEPFIEQAENLKPLLNEKIVTPTSMLEIKSDKEVIHGWKSEYVAPASTLANCVYGKGDSVILDFGNHEVGYLTINIRPEGSPPDAPLKLKLTFGEMPVEITEPFENYNVLGRNDSRWG